MILVDSDIFIDVLRGYGPALEWIEKTVAEDEIILPGYVVMELIQGSRNREEQEKMFGMIDAYQVGWPSEETCERAMELLAGNHFRSGLGIIDALIGQMALDMGIPLRTCNKRHYSDIPGLKVIVPYKKNEN